MVRTRGRSKSRLSNVIDTFATWSGPIYYDLSHYLFALKAPRHRVYGRVSGRWAAAVDAVELEFLTGYFADAPIPLATTASPRRR